MKTTIVALMLAALALPADARKRGAGRAQVKRDRQEERQEAKEKREREREREILKKFLADTDKNDDGSVSRDEYLASRLDKEAAAKDFDRYNKNGDRSLTRTEIEALLGL